jgi:hypothetical protein
VYFDCLRGVQVLSTKDGGNANRDAVEMQIPVPSRTQPKCNERTSIQGLN